MKAKYFTKIRKQVNGIMYRTENIYLTISAMRKMYLQNHQKMLV